MPKYEKWLGASIGWAVGGPLGGLLGYLAGSLGGEEQEGPGSASAEGITELELNMIVLASHLIKIDGYVNNREIEFTKQFFNTHFNERFAEKRSQIINHCLTKEYDLNVVCDQLRMYTSQSTRTQVVRFLLELASSDGDMNEREQYFIFRIAGYINVNDVQFKRLKKEHLEDQPETVYDTLGVKRDMSFEEIRTVYRKLVLKHHPDRNKTATEEERKELNRRFQRIQEAYKHIKATREGSK